MDPHVDTVRYGGRIHFWGRIKIWEVINKNGQIVNNKTFFGMLGTIQNYKYQYQFVFILE